MSWLKNLFNRNSSKCKCHTPLVFGYGDRVKVIAGSYKGQTGICEDFTMGDICVKLDEVGTKHFNPHNLEKIND